MKQKPGPYIEASRQDEDEIEYEATIEEYLGDYDDEFPPVTPAQPSQHASEHIQLAPTATARTVLH
ncbi:hypothetical protein [Caballeronia zhejiangensis]|uniref:hypothetical protein n=1 Tax=Caballeronia zhejiangensis TaxID=871203 RepID=UPI001EF5A256|nr:hypothetical protein [Caballeronia zhejiangensis]MCG7399697.1 hypothetical protein [Caballeronia zhejiangensis]